MYGPECGLRYCGVILRVCQPMVGARHVVRGISKRKRPIIPRTPQYHLFSSRTEPQSLDRVHAACARGREPCYGWSMHAPCYSWRPFCHFELPYAPPPSGPVNVTHDAGTLPVHSGGMHFGTRLQVERTSLVCSTCGRNSCSSYARFKTSFNHADCSGPLRDRG